MNNWPYIKKLLNKLEQTWKIHSYSPNWIIDIEGLIINGDAEEVIYLLLEILGEEEPPDLVDFLESQDLL